jgi:hypothetical protein
MNRLLLVVVGSCFALMVGAPLAQAASAPPSVTSETASAITTNDATLEAVVDPGDGAAGAYYQFQFSEFPTEFPDELACPPPPDSGPFMPCVGPQSQGALPIGRITADEESAEVSLDLATAGITLEPGKSYYFRVVAAAAIASEDTVEWEKPAVGGPATSFTTASRPPDPVDPPANSGAPPAAVVLPSPQTLLPSPKTHRRHHLHHHRHLGIAVARARIAF